MPCLKKRSRYIWWIPVTLMLAYLPITSFFLAIKNDFFRGYFPVKYYFSQSLHAGELPLWNPFVNYGFPLYGDMSASFWNPLTWIFGAFGYSTYSFTFELILYLLASGYGMYLLSGLWIRKPMWRYVFAIAYMCSGFQVGQLQHFNWITSSALLPYCLFMFLQWTRHSQTSYLIGALLCFSLFATAAHPGMLIGACIFFTAAGIFYFAGSPQRKRYAFNLAILVTALLVMCSGMIWAYLDVLPFTNRHAPVSAAQMTGGATELWSWASLLLPLSVTSQTGFMHGDIALRNVYLGLIPLAGLICLARFTKSLSALFYLGIGLLFVLVASPLLPVLYAKLPLLNTVRLRGEFRLFAVLSFFLASIIAISRVENDPVRLIGPLKLVRLLLLASLVAGILGVFVFRQSILFSYSGSESLTLLQQLKNVVTGLSWPDKILLQSAMQAVIVSTMIASLRTHKEERIGKLVSAEFILSTLICLPYTGVGTATLGEVTTLVRQSPTTTLKVYTSPEREIVARFPNTDAVLNSWSFYSKYAAMDGQMSYPLLLNTSEVFFSSGEHSALLSKPFCFSAGNSVIEPTGNSYQAFSFLVHAEQEDTIVIKQNYFPGWQATMDSLHIPVFTTHNSLVSVLIPPGTHRVRLFYQRPLAAWLTIIQLCLFLALLCMAIYRAYRIRYILP